MKKIFSFIIIMLLIIVSSGTYIFSSGNIKKSPRAAQKRKYSDEILIRSAVNKIEQAIKNNDTNAFTHILKVEIEDSKGKTVNRKDMLNKHKNYVSKIKKSKRSKYSQRRMPNSKKITANWDFEIDLDEIKIKKKGEIAEVQCDIYFAFDQPEDIEDAKGIKYGKKPKRRKVKMHFIKSHGKWKLEKADNLFKMLDERVIELQG